MDQQHRIMNRRYYAVTLKLASPLGTSAGFSVETDADILRDGNGDLFIPGSSIAGALRDYQLRNYRGDTQDVTKAYGFSSGEDGLMSPISIQDLYFTNTPVVSIRDGVKLKEGKTVDNKFDREIIETGAEGTLFLSCVEREGDKTAYADVIAHALTALDEGVVRLGARKNRGFGRVKLCEVYESFFDCTDPRTLKEYLLFLPHRREPASYKQRETFKNWKERQQTTGSDYRTDYVWLKIPLRQKGGISIRRYSTEPEKADYEHITCNGKPVVPGSSWNGAFRSSARRILKELGCPDTEKLLDLWFGHIGEERSREKGEQSMVVFPESILDGGRMVPATRNAIDRFTGGSSTGALYSEVCCYLGKVKLEILVKKDPEEVWKPLAGLLLLIADEIRNGYIAVGGMTSIGRGLFEADGDISLHPGISREECMAQLFKVITERGSAAGSHTGGQHE